MMEEEAVSLPTTTYGVEPFDKTSLTGGGTCLTGQAGLGGLPVPAPGPSANDSGASSVSFHTADGDSFTDISTRDNEISTRDNEISTRASVDISEIPQSPCNNARTPPPMSDDTTASDAAATNVDTTDTTSTSDDTTTEQCVGDCAVVSGGDDPTVEHVELTKLEREEPEAMEVDQLTEAENYDDNGCTASVKERGKESDLELNTSLDTTTKDDTQKSNHNSPTITPATAATSDSKNSEFEVNQPPPQDITDQCNDSTVPPLTKPDCRDIAAFSSSVPSEVGGGGKEGITDQCNESTMPPLTKPDCRDIAAISSSVPSEVGGGGKEGITDQCNESTVPPLTKPDCRDIAAISSSVPSEVEGGREGGNHRPMQ